MVNIFSIFLRHFTANEEFHHSKSGLCDNYLRQRLELSKIIYAISDYAILFKKRDIVSRERANNIDNTCERSEKYSWLVSVTKRRAAIFFILILF